MIVPSQQMTHSRRLLIRSGLVTGSTLAALMGAQILATLDQKQFDTEATPEIAPITPASAALPASPTVAPPTLVPTVTSTAEIIEAAPNIVILRHPGQIAAATGNSASLATQQPTPRPQVAARVNIQPPNPVAVAPPAPVIVQGEAPPPIIVQVGGSSSSSSSPRSHSS